MSSAKIAGAPISWGVCEVPGWGYQLAPQRVLAEMRDAGTGGQRTRAGGLPAADPCQLTALLGRYGLSCVGMFAPVVLHDAGHDPVLDVAAPLDALIAANAGILVLAAATGSDGYDSRPQLDDGQWRRCWPTWTGSPPQPLSAVSRPSCTRMSAPWSRPAPRWTAY